MKIQTALDETQECVKVENYITKHSVQDGKRKLSNNNCFGTQEQRELAPEQQFEPVSPESICNKLLNHRDQQCS
jgi:hypothetical protein